MSITSTLIIQLIVFLLLVWFTMSKVWPPIAAALDARAAKIREGLSAADKAKADLAAANTRVEQELSAARNDAAQRLADAERLAQSMFEESKSRASEEAPRSSPRPTPGRAGSDQGARDPARAVAALAVRAGADPAPRSRCEDPADLLTAQGAAVRWQSSPPSPGRTPRHC